MKKALCMLLAMLMLFGLCACGGSGGSAPAAANAPKAAEEIPEAAYNILVTDPEGNPIPNVKLEFCDDTGCRTGDTDRNGSAVFTAKEGTYAVHVLAVPEGVVGTDEEFSFPDAGRELQIALERPEPVLSRPFIGFSYYDPPKYRDLNGDLVWEVAQLDFDIYALDMIYRKMLDAEFFKELGLDEIPEVYTSLGLFNLICVLKDESEAEDYLRDTIKPNAGWDSVSLEKIGTAENLTCFLTHSSSSEDLEQYRDNMGDNFEEYAALREDQETFISGIKLQKPAAWNLCFESSDLDGSAVSTADVFAGHKVTMINVWATWCDPCIEELPQLEKLSKDFEEKDCQIIGVCLDCYAGSDTSRAKAILEEAGVTYLNLMAPQNDDELFPLNSFPTSFFVDSSGNVLTMPFEGAPPTGYIHLYSNALKDALSKLDG